MMKKLYQSIATGVVASLMLTMLMAVPAAAQSTAGTAQDSSPSQSQSPCVPAGFGTGADTAVAPVVDCWLSIAPGQKQWYKFKVGARSNEGDEKNNFDNANGVDDSDAAIVQLAMDTPGCVGFEIWTLARLNAPPRVGNDASREEKRQDREIIRGPVGVGSPIFAVVDDTSHSSQTSANNSDSDKNRDLAHLIWRGGSTVSENFYIVVRNLRTDSACSYRLAVAGSTVSFPGAK